MLSRIDTSGENLDNGNDSRINFTLRFAFAKHKQAPVGESSIVQLVSFPGKETIPE
jgi:hypothetical protein